MTIISKMIYPKLIAWNYKPEKLCYATIPANCKQEISMLLAFVDQNNEFSTNFSKVDLVDNIFPCDEVVFFDNMAQVMLILNIEELRQAYKETK